ncbi:MAG: AraC family transcriptional regulator [Paenibacillus sp.]|jgi:AraC-like DNA-binding protein/quercetin dioxygenase-like cupin family protein|nr:AraC family transcriptional regulator [Paenibacillus sp.]
MKDHGVSEILDFLLRSAELNINLFDISTRTEMKTMNRIRPSYVMSYHKRGTSKLRIGNTVHKIEPGTVILIPPYVEHDHYKEGMDETVFLWCHFTFEIAGIIDVLKIFEFPITFQLKERRDDFEKLFVQYKELISSKGFPETILKKAKELELLYLLLLNAMQVGQASEVTDQSKNFFGILATILRHPEQEMSLTMLSKKLNMHPTYISNRFKELFGKSPIFVQREMKIHKAKKLLETSDMTINDVAQAIGVNGMSNFSRLFKLHVGISPSQYRQMNKKSGVHL